MLGATKLMALEGTSDSLKVPGLNALGTFEQRVMEVFWSKEPGQEMTCSDVQVILMRMHIEDPSNPMVAYTTTKTTMTRLTEKGLLHITYIAGNQAAVYVATMTRQQFIEKAVTAVVTQMATLAPDVAERALRVALPMSSTVN